MKHEDDHPGPAVYDDLHEQWSGTVATLTGPEGRPGPEVVASAVADAIEDPATPLRVEVGRTPPWCSGSGGRSTTPQFEATMREALGLTW